MRKVGIGLAGFGAIARKHLAAIRACEGADAIGIFDPSADARAAAAKDGLRAFDRAEDLFAMRGLDGVILCTPNQLHAAGAVRCIERGLPVLIEKPLSDSVAGGESILAAQRKFGTPVLVGHHRRHNPLIRRARDIVRSGALGQVTAIAGLTLFLKPDEYFDIGWRREAGAGPVLINLIHDIDDLRFICGEIVAIEAMTSAGRRGFAVEDSAAVIARFDNGALATLIVSDAVAAPWSWELTSGENPIYPRQHENCYLIAGTEGSLALPKLELWRYGGTRGWHAELAREALTAEIAEPFLLQLRHFVDVIQGRAAPLVTVEDALRTLHVTLAVQRAGRRERALGGGDAAPDPGTVL